MILKLSLPLLILALSTLILPACASQPADAREPASAKDSSTPLVTDSLIEKLEESDATVERGDEVDQAFFTPVGKIIKVNGQDVQVFEYPSQLDAEDEAAEVAPDGGSIGTFMVTWIDTPHFFKSGNLIALYVGSDAGVIAYLEGVLGSQFAGG